MLQCRYVPRIYVYYTPGHGVGAPELLAPAYGLRYLAPTATRSLLVAHLLAFLEATIPLALYAGVVHEDVPLAGGVGLYETVALLLGKPFHRSPGHDKFSPLFFTSSPKRARPGTFGGVAKRFFLFWHRASSSLLPTRLGGASN